MSLQRSLVHSRSMTVLLMNAQVGRSRKLGGRGFIAVEFHKHHVIIRCSKRY